MDSLLDKCGLTTVGSSHAPRSDVAMLLDQAPIGKLKCLRLELFVLCQELNLTDGRDILVGRKNTPTNPIRKKLIEDVILLDRCVKDKNPIPRTLLKNGKRSRQEFEESRVLSNLQVSTMDDPTIRQSHSTNTVPTEPTPPHINPTIIGGTTNIPDHQSTSLSLITTSLNLLRKDMDTIKQD